MSLRTALLLGLLVAASPVATAETVFVPASRDATLIEDPDGARANGSGPYAFFGRTSQAHDSIRRALLRFDVAAAVPRHAIIEAVWLHLYIDTNNPVLIDARLHRVLADWGEGASSASGGFGAPALPGDATWLHTFYDEAFWTRAGGQFVARASARLAVAEEGKYTWPGNDHLVQDVRLWRSNPRVNFGWILLGDETLSQSSKSFVTRESPEADLRPVLEVRYHLPGNRQAPR